MLAHPGFMCARAFTLFTVALVVIEIEYFPLVAHVMPHNSDRNEMKLNRSAYKSSTKKTQQYFNEIIF